METLVGNMTSFTVDRVGDYFKGKILSRLTNYISDKMTCDGISILTINSHLAEISLFVEQALSVEFEKYGLGLENFTVISINVPDSDPSLLKLKEAKDFSARLKITGKDMYQMERSFNVLDKMAENEGNVGNLMNMGLGIGTGLGLGNQVGTMASQVLNTSNVQPPALNQCSVYYLALNGQQQGPFDINMVSTFITNKQIDIETLAWKQGMANWIKISLFEEFAQLFTSCPPPLPSV